MCRKKLLFGKNAVGSENMLNNLKVHILCRHPARRPVKRSCIYYSTGAPAQIRIKLGKFWREAANCYAVFFEIRLSSSIAARSCPI